MRGDLPYPEGSTGGPQPQIERPVGKRRARISCKHKLRRREGDSAGSHDPAAFNFLLEGLPLEERTPEGFPLSYEVFAGNRAEVTTLEEMLDAVERKHGRARRMWVFDRGIVSEENLQSLRRAGASYLVGTPRAQLKAYERRLLEGDWQRVSGEVEVQLIAQDKETYVLARSRARAQKESAMRLRVVRGLMRDSLPATAVASPWPA
jgi:Transposase DDE domain